MNPVNVVDELEYGIIRSKEDMWVFTAVDETEKMECFRIVFYIVFKVPE